MDTMAVVMDTSGIMEIEEGAVETMVVGNEEEDEEVIQAEEALLDSAANEAALEGSSKKRQDNQFRYFCVENMFSVAQ